MTDNTLEPAAGMMKEMGRLVGVKTPLRAHVFNVQKCSQKNMAQQTRIDIFYDGFYDGRWLPQMVAAHAHDAKADAFFGQICFNPRFLSLLNETNIRFLEEVVAHEVAHFREQGHNKDHDRLTQTLVDSYRRLHPPTPLRETGRLKNAFVLRRET